MASAPEIGWPDAPGLSYVNREKHELLMCQSTARADCTLRVPGVVGEDADRLPQTSCLAFPMVDRQALLMALDLKGLACSTGSACASGSSEPSAVLRAMGLSDHLVEAAVRFSVGTQTTEEQISTAVRWISTVVNVLRAGR